MRRWVTAAVIGALLAPASAHAATAPVVLGKGPGGLLALDASAGTAYAVIGRPDWSKPLGVLTSDGRTAGPVRGFGVNKARDPDVVAGPDGAVVSWARWVTGGVEYSTAAVRDGGVGEADFAASGTGPPRLALIDEQPLIARSDKFGDVAIGDDTVTSDGLERRHLPLDVTSVGEVPLVLDLAQGPRSSALKVLGKDVPDSSILALGSREDLDGSIAADDARLYVGFLRRGLAYLAIAERRPGARWSVRRLPGEGGGEGAPAVARSGGYTWVAYAQNDGRRDIFLVRAGVGATRLTQLTSDPLDDTRPRIAPAGNGQVFVGWTREERGAQTGTALLIKTG